MPLGGNVAREHGRLLALTRAAAERMSLEDVLTSAVGFGLDTATPMQRAVCRLFDGRPLGDLAEHPDVIDYIGDVSELEGEYPREGVLCCGIRTAKSIISAALAVRLSQRVDVSGLTAGEKPRIPILSVEKDLAQVIYQHLEGLVSSSALVGTLLLGEPKAESLMLRHPTGRKIEIKVTAGKKAGSSVIARWLAGLIFDEAPRIASTAEDGVVNLKDTVTAAKGRMLPGSGIYYIGSPHAPFGEVYNRVESHHMNASKSCVVIKAPAWTMNPQWWTEERCEEVKREDPDAYQTDVLANFLDPAERMFSLEMLRGISQPPEEARPGFQYYAAMDPATRNNAWTLVVGTREGDQKRVVYAREWVPRGKPLSPKRVLSEIAEDLAPYRIKHIETDQWSVDALRDRAEDFGLHVHQRTMTNAKTYLALKELATWATDGNLTLVKNTHVIQDLHNVRRRARSTGVVIELPVTPDGRHCDYAPSLARLCSRWMDDYQKPLPPKGTPERLEHEDREREEREMHEFEQAQRKTRRRRRY